MKRTQVNEEAGKHGALLLAPVVAELHPDDVLEMQLLPGPAVIAEPAAIRHVDVQAVGVEGSRAGLATQEASPCKAGRAGSDRPHPSTAAPCLMLRAASWQLAGYKLKITFEGRLAGSVG